jgi:hypothetical protein
MPKITELTADTSPTADDLLVTVNDPSGSPTNRKVSIGNLKIVSNRNEITQTSHGFVAGDVLYYTGTVWAKAKADALSTSYALGVVESAATSTFVIVFSGSMTTPSLTANTVYYLSDATAGLLTSTQPTTTTSFLVPILTTTTTTNGVVKIQPPLTLALITAADTDFAKKSNFSASGAPSTGNDNTQGYAKGSLWFSNTHIYGCVSAATGAADWLQLDGTSTPDTTPPTLVSATVAANGTTLTLVFDENVTSGTDGMSSGLAISGITTTITYASGTGTDTILYTLGTTVLGTDTITIAYTQPGDGIQDPSANLLANFSATSITNNSTQTGGGGLMTDLVAYWKLDEASGNRADSVGGQTLTDHSVGSSAGKINTYAADFSSTYLDHADSSVLSVPIDSDFTITGWFYARANAYGGIFGKSGVSGLGYNTDCEYVISTVDYNGTNIGLYFNASDGTTVPSATVNNITKNAWHFFVAWYDSAAGYLYLQIDNGTPGSAASTHGSFDSTSSLYVGKFGAGFNYDGKLENVGLWKRVLDSTERSNLWNGGSGLPFSSF